MLPLGDENRPGRITPIVTYILLAINVLVFLYQLSLGPALEEFLFTYGMIPDNILRGSGFLTLLTSIFLHGGWGHIFSNMLFLFIFGDNVEDALGHGLFLLFYLVTGLAASFTHIALNPDSTIPTIGASGAISGVLGAYIAMFGNNRVRVLIGVFVAVVPAFLMIGLWALTQFVSAYTAYVDPSFLTSTAYGAHAGGFLAGLLLALLLRPLRRPEIQRHRADTAALARRGMFFRR